MANANSNLNLTVETDSQKRRFRYSLTIGIMVMIILSSLLSALFMHTAWRLFVINSTSQLSTRINKEIFSSVRNELNRVFYDVVRTQDTLYNIISNDIVDDSNNDEIRTLYINTMLSHEEFTWISFGRPNGDFLGVRRLPEDILEWNESIYNFTTQDATRRIEQYQSVDRSTNIIGNSTITNTYYAPQRPWFRDAVAAPNLQDIWTDVYVFSTSQLPGINSAVALRDADQELVNGVISIAIELGHLSDYIAGIEVFSDGVLFVINQKKEIIAYHKKDEVVSVSPDNNFTLRSLVASNDARLRVVGEFFNAENIVLGEQDEFLSATFESPEDETEYSIFLEKISDLSDDTINLSSLGWYVGATIPTVDLLGAIDRSSQTSLLIVYVMIAVMIVAVCIFVRVKLTKPIRQIAGQAEHIQRFELESVQLPESSLVEIDLLTQAMSKMSTGLHSFRKYVPTELVQRLINRGLEAKLGGVEGNVTVFFCDIAQFTYISELMREEIVEHLGTYFTYLSDVIRSHDGTIDKYIGDAIMAFWGAPNPQDDHAVSACHAALRCTQTLRRLRADWKSRGKELLFARFGLNSGKVLVGNFGSDLRMSYTAIGDPVNVASRLEGLNKIYGTEIIIGGSTYDQVNDYFVTRKLDRVAVHGRTQPVEVAELIGVKDNDYHPDQYQWIYMFEQGLRHYRAQEWSEAIGYFLQSYEKREGEDNASLLFIKRCKHLMQREIPADWNGAFIPQSK